MLNVSATGELILETQLMPDNKGVTLGFSQLRLSVDDKTETYVYAKRQQKPADSVGKEALARWENMLNKRRDFSNTLAHDQSLEVFWVRSVTGAKVSGSEDFARDTNVLYEIVYQTDQKILPRELEARRTELAKTFRILER